MCELPEQSDTYNLTIMSPWLQPDFTAAMDKAEYERFLSELAKSALKLSVCYL